MTLNHCKFQVFKFNLIGKAFYNQYSDIVILIQFKFEIFVKIIKQVSNLELERNAINCLRIFNTTVIGQIDYCVFDSSVFGGY